MECIFTYIAVSRRCQHVHECWSTTEDDDGELGPVIPAEFIFRDGRKKNAQGRALLCYPHRTRWLRDRRLRSDDDDDP
jgi:hypothetical protein